MVDFADLQVLIHRTGIRIRMPRSRRMISGEFDREVKHALTCIALFVRTMLLGTIELM